MMQRIQQLPLAAMLATGLVALTVLVVVVVVAVRLIIGG